MTAPCETGEQGASLWGASAVLGRTDFSVLLSGIDCGYRGEALKNLPHKEPKYREPVILPPLQKAKGPTDTPKSLEIIYFFDALGFSSGASHEQAWEKWVRG